MGLSTKKIALLLHPASVQVEHDGIGALVGVRNIGHEVRGEWGYSGASGAGRRNL